MNLDLSEHAGLPIHLTPAPQLEFGAGVVVDEFKIRHFSELSAVYLDLSVAGDEAAYFMYNGVYREADAPLLAEAGLRYELTLFPDRRIGHEYVKTLGHLHAAEPQSGIDYPEICEVLHGVAHFFFQKFGAAPHTALEAFYVEVHSGEKIIIPPGYHHLTINPGPGPLLFSDVVAPGVSGLYEDFKQAGGAAYLEVEKAGGAQFVPNPRYSAAPPLARLRPRQFPDLNLSPAQPLYQALLERRGAGWEFLRQPAQFQAQWTGQDVFIA